MTGEQMRQLAPDYAFKIHGQPEALTDERIGLLLSTAKRFERYLAYGETAAPAASE